jgi:hypothetical protein
VQTADLKMFPLLYILLLIRKDIEETFIEGANIYIKNQMILLSLKKVIKEVLNINWQFHSSGLNKETFFFSI